MKKYLVTILAITLLLSVAPVAYGSEEMPEGLYGIESISDEFDSFTNFVHGYSMKIPKGMKADMSISEVCAILERDNLRIEIYKQPIGDGISLSTYQNYSNKFLENTRDHTNELKSVETVNGNTVNIFQYSRDKLARIPNDRNYYVNLDVVTSNYVYSMFVKSTDPFWDIGGYHYLVEEFEIFEPTQAPFTRTTKSVSLEDRGYNDETASLFTKYFSDESPLTWGIFEPSAPGGLLQLDWLEEEMEYNFPFLLNYTSFENTSAHPDLRNRLETSYDKGKTLELTLQTPIQSVEEGNMVYDILNGHYDAFLSDYAKQVSDFDHPVLFRLGNEMNGDWCPYSSFHTAKDTEIFKAFYKYIYSFFENEKADNVIWVWNPNHKSFPNFLWNHELMYYPGDEYVDIVGLTAYNTGTYYEAEKWTEFEDLYDEIYYEYERRYSQPLIITEFASSSVGGDKNQWIKDMFKTIKKYEGIKLAIWWDGNDWDVDGNIARPYFIDETPELLETFREYFKKNPSNWDTYG